MANYIQHFAALFTRQKEKARPDQVENYAGGFVFELDDWGRLDRWLVLGCEGGTYYATERALTQDNARALGRCLDADGERTIRRIVEISRSGRAPKNEPAIFALAMAAGHARPEVRKSALAALPEVCRTGTDLFHFARAVEGFRRWGRGLRSAIGAWYQGKSPDELAYQAVKYRQRDGWSHKDLLRLSHPTPVTAEHGAMYRWIVGGMDALKNEAAKGGALDPEKLPALVRAFEEAKDAPRERLVTLVREQRLTHEMVPTEWKNDPAVWEALLPHMPQTAMLRNLGKMTSVGLLAPMSAAARLVASRLTDVERLRRARIHPVSVLSALRVYAQGRGERAQKRENALTWEPVREIVDALDEAFYLAFRSIEPTGKKHLLALDVSGSMDSGTIAGIPGLTPRVASAAMAMATARIEPSFSTLAFASAGGAFGPRGSGVMSLPLSPKQRLDDVVGMVSGLPFGGTDCALPMIWAQKNKVEVDTFVVYTDSETWAGEIHPFQALRDYRQAMGRPAKLVVVGMTSTGFTIADPQDPGMLDVVGFDAAAPQVMADFSRA
ncbi:TROVE domain-containing protein [Polyangium sp. 15x6]|uniref:TROVE domain-containing protein n=1 Tax=Polyangium sp. 15x6 TaxID=3042687 RepID=UPI00249B5E9A|nr:TROVE domain-containing protein [Polyangium sp. 15x6]MDI3282981.1 TROVE domain-containing protein [Polyangium sp. 15x6]